MDNEEIKALLRELKSRSDESDEVKGKPVKISLDEEEPPVREKNRGLSLFGKRKNEKKETEKKETEKKGTEKKETEKKDTEKEKNETQKNGKKETEKKKTRKKEIENKETENRENEELLPETPENGAVGKASWKKLKSAVGFRLADLKDKGIGERELIMIGAGIVLVIFLVFAVFGALFGKDKSLNVTADDGLYVTVEEEPENWCRESRVVLGIRSRDVIQSVMINGKAAEFESGRRILVETDAKTGVLELMVVTETSVLNAKVEIPMIDSEAPSVALQQENGQVTITASDERSGLEGIYYGTLTGFSEVPRYQKYTGPFACEEGKMYFYYAKDYAGNRTVPVETDMEPAQAIAWDETETILFPGDSTVLRLTASPEKSYYNHLQITNRNPETVSLSETGTVTALKEGDAVIEAQADGLAAVSCLIQVRSEAEVTITAVGDCTLGDDVSFSSANSFSTVYSMYGADWFFQNVRSILEEDDITFANLEGTLTTADTRQNKQYAFKGAPQYVDILKNGSVEAVTLANNHSSDYGEQSLSDTKQVLTEAGIDYCMGDQIVYRNVNGAKVALIGIYVLDEGIGKAGQVEETVTLAKQNGADLIVAGFHWGSEKSNYPDEVQQSLAHTAIDCGADLVVGHHPHVLQGIEQYQGKYIVYSLGNFCFGGNSNPSDTDTMMFQQTFTLDKEGNVTDTRIRIIPCSVTSQYGGNNYQPTPQEGAEAERIIGRINEYSAQFGLVFE